MFWDRSVSNSLILQILLLRETERGGDTKRERTISLIPETIYYFSSPLRKCVWPKPEHRTNSIQVYSSIFLSAMLAQCNGQRNKQLTPNPETSVWEFLRICQFPWILKRFLTSLEINILTTHFLSFVLCLWPRFDWLIDWLIDFSTITVCSRLNAAWNMN